MINRVVINGRLTRKPELKQTKSGKSVVQFTLAVARKFGKDSEADFINCVAWNKTAESLVSYSDKGRLISAEGRIQTRSYQDKDGKTVYVTEVIVDRIQFMDSGQAAAKGQQSIKPFEDTGSLEISDDDLPF